MKLLARILVLLFLALPASAQIITLTLTTTNRAVTSNSFTVNGSSRVFTNVTGALTVATNLSSVNATKTNLFNQIAAFPLTGVSLLTDAAVGPTAASNIILRSSFGAALSGSVTGNWGFLTLSTQTGPNTFTMLYPVANIVGTTNRTNQASDMVSALNTFATNFISTNAVPFSNYLSKGASPVQSVRGPVEFWGQTAINSNFFATNGFTKSITNIDSVSSNHVNFGNALRSEGPGANSLQLGSNAMALGTRTMAIGNGAFATNTDALAIGTGAIATNNTSLAIGNSARAGYNNAAAVGNSSYASNNATALGTGASAGGRDSVAVGSVANAAGRDNVALGQGSSAPAETGAGAIGDATVASALYSWAIGGGASATHSNSMALGPRSAGFGNVSTTTTNEIVIGTVDHHVRIPGFLRTVQGASNFLTVATSTNILGGAFAYPPYSLSTIANGNNISVPLGSNRYVRLSGTVTASPTLCGFIGGATSGGIPGQEVLLHNDLGFAATLAQNTVDPVPANRIETTDGSDVSLANNGWAILEYSAADSRWHISFVYPTTAIATNGLGVYVIQTNGVAVSTAATNLNFVFPQSVGVTATNASGKVDIQIISPGHLFTITNDVIVTNVTGSVSMLSNLLGSATIPANYWQPGMSIEIDLFGKYFMTATLTQSNEVYYGASLLGTNSMPWFAASGDAFSSHVTITCRTIGASGSLYCQGFLEIPSSINGVSGVTKNIRLVSGAVTVNTTVATALDYKFNPGATTTALHIHAGGAKVIP